MWNQLTTSKGGLRKKRNGAWIGYKMLTVISARKVAV